MPAPLPLFPFPCFGKGSKDTGPSGPVRLLQNVLLAHMPEFGRAIGLIPDGDYGDKTVAAITALQHVALLEGSLEPEEVTGFFDLATRRYVAAALTLDFDCVPFQEGGGCMYMAPGFAEPKLWTPDASRPPDQADLREEATSTPQYQGVPCTD